MTREAASAEAVPLRLKAQEHFLKHEWPEACHYYEAAAEAFEKSGILDYQAAIFHQWSVGLVRLGRYGEAAGILERSLQEAIRLGDFQAEGNALNGLAEIQWVLADPAGWAVNLQRLRRAEECFRRINAPFYEARMVCNQALHYERINQMGHGQRNVLARCEHAARRGLRLLQGIPDDAEVRIQRASTLGMIARCQYHGGDWRQAALQFEQAAELVRDDKQILICDRALCGHAWVKASVDARAQEALEADRLVHRGMECLEAAVRGAWSNANQDDRIETLSARGDAFWDLQHWEAAVRDYETACGLIDSRGFVLSRPYERTAIRRRLQRLYPRMIEAHLRAAAADPLQAGRHIGLAFRHSEQAKARLLSDLLATQDLLSRLPQELRGEVESQFRRQQQAFLRKELVAKSPDATSEEIGSASESLREAERSLQEVLRKMLETQPALKEWILPHELSFDELRSRLPDSFTAVLELSVCEGGLAVFLVSKDGEPEDSGFLLTEIDGRRITERVHRFIASYNEFADLQTRIEARQREFAAAKPADSRIRAIRKKELLLAERDLERSVRTWMVQLPEVLMSLREEIVCAAAGQFSIDRLLRARGVKRLSIVPDNVLNRLPLHAVMPDAVSCTYSPSASVLLQSVKSLERLPKAALIVDDPGENMEPARWEADLITRRLEAAGVAVTRLSRKEATPEAILKAMPFHAWMHYAGHAASDPSSPWKSWLLAAPPAGLKTAEGCHLEALVVAEKGRVPRGSVAVLSSCSSGVCPEDRSGEFSGLPAALLVAGYSLVVSTLWEVHEEVPVLLMDFFYRNLFEGGMSHDEAVKHAVTQVRNLSHEEVLEFERRNHLPTGSILPLRVWSAFPPDHPVHWAPFLAWGAGWTADEADIGTTPSSTESLPALPSAASSLDQVLAFNEAARFYEQNRFREAAQAAERNLAQWGPSFSAHHLAGAAYTDLEILPLALEHQLAALRMNPNSYRAHFDLGYTFMSLSRPSEARSAFREVLRLNPGHAKAMFNLAQLVNDPVEALRLARRAAALDEGDPELGPLVAMWERLAAALRNGTLNMGFQRILWAEEALQKPDFEVAWRQLALARELPLSQAMQALAFDTESTILRLEGNLAASIAAQERSVQLDPTKAYSWNNLGARQSRLAEKTEREEERFELYRQAISNCRQAANIEEFARPHQNIAHASLCLGDPVTGRSEAHIALDYAQRQIANGPAGPLICKGCATMGQQSAECRSCLEKAKTTIRNAEKVLLMGKAFL
jgi:tetratricopeptide (TPR) repeat protein